MCLLLAACQREKPQPIKQTPIVQVAPATTTGIAACDDYLRRVAACTKLTPAMRATLAHGGGIWKAAADQGGAPAKATTASCDELAKLAAPSLSEVGC
jgi:hypothetical protein